MAHGETETLKVFTLPSQGFHLSPATVRYCLSQFSVPALGSQDRRAAAAAVQSAVVLSGHCVEGAAFGGSWEPTVSDMGWEENPEPPQGGDSVSLTTQVQLAPRGGSACGVHVVRVPPSVSQFFIYLFLSGHLGPVT